MAAKGLREKCSFGFARGKRATRNDDIQGEVAGCTTLGFVRVGLGVACWVFACGALAFHTGQFLTNVSPAGSPLGQKKQAAEKERTALTKPRTRQPKSFSRITSGPPALRVFRFCSSSPMLSLMSEVSSNAFAKPLVCGGNF